MAALAADLHRRRRVPGEFLDFAQRHADRGRIAAHDLYLGLRQRRTYLDEAADVPLKKLFYALRPAMALRWLRTHPGEAVAPMPCRR